LESCQIQIAKEDLTTFGKLSNPNR